MASCSDYSLGIRANLVDRDIYRHEKEYSFEEEEESASNDQKLLLSQKLKYVLSDVDNFDPYEA